MSHQKHPRTAAFGRRALAMTASILLLPAAWAGTTGDTAKKNDKAAATPATTTAKTSKATSTTGTAKKKHHKKAAAKAATAPGSAGQVVAKDPVTGQLRPATVNEQLALRNGRAARLQTDFAARRAAALSAVPPASGKYGVKKIEAVEADSGVYQLTTYDNGMTSISVDDSFNNYAVATKGADGKVTIGCLDNKKQKDEFMKNAAKGKKVNAAVKTLEVSSDR